MPRLEELLPDTDALLALSPAELAPYVLEAAKSQGQNGMIHREALAYGMFQGDSHALNNPNAYPRDKSADIGFAIAEAFSWLEASQLLIPAESTNGNNGWLRFSRRARAMAAADFANFVAAISFPRSLVHPMIREKVWAQLMRGENDTAVFIAFKSVEERVRDAAGYSAADYGVDLMRKAFHETNGPLTKASDPLSERQALAHLFAGAIGSYKNPHSHRTVVIQDSVEAQEMVVLASHLLRIVDSRAPGRPGGQ